MGSLTAAERALAVNPGFEEDLEDRVQHYLSHPHDIPCRLAELEGEWDVDSLVQIQGGVMVLLGLALGLTRSRKFLFLPALAAGFLIQHAVTGWNPPALVLGKLGFRSRAEIEAERQALLSILAGSGRTGS